MPDQLEIEVDALENKPQLFIKGLEGTLTPEEIEALASHTPLVFDINNLSFYPSKRHDDAARTLRSIYGGTSRLWNHLHVIGTFTLQIDHRNTVYGDLKVTTITPRKEEEIEDYVQSLRRPWLKPTGTKRIYISDTTDHTMNDKEMKKRIPIISFYGRNSFTISNPEKWSVHCHRARRTP